MNTEYLVWVILLVGITVGSMLFLVFAELPDFAEPAGVADVAEEPPAPARVKASESPAPEAPAPEPPAPARSA